MDAIFFFEGHNLGDGLDRLVMRLKPTLPMIKLYYTYACCIEYWLSPFVKRFDAKDCLMSKVDNHDITVAPQAHPASMVGMCS